MVKKRGSVGSSFDKFLDSCGIREDVEVSAVAAILADRGMQPDKENIFRDLGFANPEVHLLKAQLVSKIRETIEDNKNNLKNAARSTKTTPKELSLIISGQFRETSVERLLKMLVQLGCEVEIVVRPARSGTQASFFRLNGTTPS